MTPSSRSTPRLTSRRRSPCSPPKKRSTKASGPSTAPSIPPGRRDATSAPSSRRRRRRSRCSARASAWGPVPTSPQSSLQAANVRGSSGRRMTACSSGVPRLGNWEASLRRPWSTSSASSPSKPAKYRKGEEAANSWPMNSIGVAGPRRSSAVTARRQPRGAVRCRREPRPGRRVRAEAAACVGELFMFLDEDDEPLRLEVEGRGAAGLLLPAVSLALVEEAVLRGRDQLLRAPLVVAQVGLVAAGQRHDGAVVEVVVPQGVEAEAAPLAGPDEAHGLGIVLADDEDPAGCRGLAGAAGELRQDVLVALVEVVDVLGGVDPEAVDM